MEENQRLDTYLSVTPSVNQKRIQREGFNVFFHYGLNTFTGKEWGDGKTDPKAFDPSAQDTDQWIRTVKAAGAYGVILTCKHHDGFCLWQTATTDYSVAASPYKDGKGDVVKEVSNSCRKYGLKFGIYLSLWDRNCKSYGLGSAYDDFYCAQLEELLTGYGDIFCVWLDGACGCDLDGRPKQVYDWQRYFALIRKLAPNACISNCGPDVRWVGNEGGFARQSEWNVVPVAVNSINSVEENSQHIDDGKFAKKGVDLLSKDMGSREVLANYDKFMWYPAEVDVSIRKGWFYHKSQDLTVRSVRNLKKIYNDSIGGNTLLLLNLPPDTRGLIHERDAATVKKLGEYIANLEKGLVKVANISAPPAQGSRVIENVLTYEYDSVTYDPLSYYTPNDESDKYLIKIELGGRQKINRVKLVENTAFSQRIEKFEIYAYVKGKRKRVYSGTTVGYGRMAIFKPVVTDCVEVAFTQVRRKPYLEFVGVYRKQ